MSQELVSFLNFTFKNNQVETKVIDDYSTKVTKAIRWQLNWREYLSDLAKQGIYADMEHRPSLRRYSSPQPSEELYKDLSAFQNEMRQTIADIVETRKIPPNLWKRILKESDGFTVMLSPPGSFEGDITPRNIGDLNLQYTYDAPTYRNCIMGILRDLIVSGGIFKLRTYPDGRFYYDPNLQAPPGGTLDNSLGPIDNVCPADDFPAPTPVEENPQEVRFSFMISDLEEPSPPPRPKSPPNTNRHLGDQNNSKGILPPPALASNEVAPLDSLLLTNPLSDEAPLELKNPVQDPLNVPNTKDQGDDEVLELTSFNKELVQESQEAPLSEEAQLEDLKGFSGIIENLKGPSDKELALTPTESLTEGELLLSSGPAPEEELIPDAPISLSLEPQNGHPSQEKTAQYQTADAQADDLTDDHNYAKADDLTTLDLTSPLTEAPTETLVSSPPDQSVPKTQDDNTGYQTDFKNPSCDDILDLSVAISAPMEDTSDSEELLLSAPYAESMDEALDTTGGQEQLEAPAASYAPEILESSDIAPYESPQELKEPTSEITKEAPFLDAASPSLPQESSLASSPIEAPMPLEETEASFHEPLELQGALQEEGDLEQKVLSDNSTPPAETHKSSSEMAAAQTAPDTMVEPRALELTNALKEESQDLPLEESADDSTSSALATR
ncbi:MAG: hypothetical protein LBE38_07680, partial [Deltaproteobacteria bacterium]|nr:hypothetical protein [Deltaproteobacteria bacterium]